MNLLTDFDHHARDEDFNTKLDREMELALKYANHFDHFLEKLHWTEQTDTVIGEDEDK